MSARGPHHQAAFDVENDAQAAALHDKLWNHRNEHHESMSPGELRDVDSALHELEIGDESGQLVRNRRAWQRRQTRVGEQQVKRDEGHGRRRASARRTATARRPRGASGARSRAGGYSSKAWRQTGLPGLGSDSGSIVLQAIGAGIGLSLLLFLINDRGPGPKAFTTLLDGLGTGLELFVGPYDPLGGAGQVKRAATRGKRPAPARAPTTKTAPASSLVPGFRPGPLPNYSELLGAPR